MPQRLNPPPLQSDVEIARHLPRTSRAALSIRMVSLDKLYRQLLTVLVRDTEQLMIMSKRGKLASVDSQVLSGYLKLVKDLKKEEMAELENLTDEELEALAKEKKND